MILEVTSMIMLYCRLFRFSTGSLEVTNKKLKSNGILLRSLKTDENGDGNLRMVILHLKMTPCKKKEITKDYKNYKSQKQSQRAF